MHEPRCKSRRRLLVLAAAFAFGVAAIGSAAAQTKSRLQTVIDRGTVIVAVTSEFPPLGFNDDKGNLVASTSTSPSCLPRPCFRTKPG